MKRFVLAGTCVVSSLGFANAAIGDTATNSALFVAALPCPVLEKVDTAIVPGWNNLVGTYDPEPFEIERDYTEGSTGAQAGSYRTN